MEGEWIKEKKKKRKKKGYGPKMMEGELWLSLFHEKNRKHYIYAGQLAELKKAASFLCQSYSYKTAF